VGGCVFSGSNEVVAERALVHLHYAWLSHYNTQHITFLAGIRACMLANRPADVAAATRRRNGSAESRHLRITGGC
jgi:hypothetical protein